MRVTIPFTKMVGAGNDFLVVDARRSVAARRATWRAVSRALCDRHQGVGADGLLLLEPSRVADVTMRVFNPDGSEAEMCGNGARCVAVYLGANGGVARATDVAIHTKAGLVRAAVRGSRVAMRMTAPTGVRLGLVFQVQGRRVRAGAVNTGVPHVVVPVRRLETIDVQRIGRAIRSHKAFAPQGANVTFVEPDPAHSNRLRVRTYERGVEDETLACGTGIAASAVIYALTRHAASGHRMTRGSGRADWRLEVQPRSGDVLTVSLTVGLGPHGWHVRDLAMEGSAVRVFDGAVTWPLRRAR